MRTQIPTIQRPGGALPAAFAAELDSFLLSLEAENLAPPVRSVGLGDFTDACFDCRGRVHRSLFIESRLDLRVGVG